MRAATRQSLGFPRAALLRELRLAGLGDGVSVPASFRLEAASPLRVLLH